MVEAVRGTKDLQGVVGMVIQDISAGLEIVGKIAGLTRGKSLSFTPGFILEDGGKVRYAVEVVNDGKKSIVANMLGFNKRETPIRIEAGEVARQAMRPGPRNRVEVPLRLEPSDSLWVVQKEADCSKWIRGAARDTEGNFYAEHTWVRIVTTMQSTGLNHQMEVDEETEKEREALGEIELATKQGRKTKRKRGRKRRKTRLKMQVHMMAEEVKRIVKK